MDSVKVCQQCFEEYKVRGSHSRDDGFCSDYCLEEYEEQIGSEDSEEEESDEEE